MLSNYLEQSLRLVYVSDVTETMIWVILGVFLFCLWSAKTNKHPALVAYAPTLLTSLGIFGTFIGIVIGLLEFDPNNIDKSIQLLLEGLKTAFITSIVGMATSIIFKALHSLKFFHPEPGEVSEQDVTPNHIYEGINQQITVLKELKRLIAGDEDSTLISQLKLLRSDLNTNDKARAKILEDMKADSSSQLELAAERNQSFETFSNKLWIQLQDFSDTLSKSATEQVIEALKQVITDFNNNLTEQFGENFKQLNAAVEKLVAWQDNYKEQLGQMTEQYQQGILAITQTEQSITHISEESKAIPSAMADLKTIMEINQHQLSELENHLKAFETMKDKAVEAVPEIRKQVSETVNEIASSVQLASEHYTKLLSKSDNYIQSHKELVNDIIEESRNLSNAFKDSNKELVADTKQVREEVTNSIKEMQNHLENTLQEVFQKQVSEVSKTFNALESEIKKTVGLTSEAVDKQLSAIDQSMQQEINRVMTEMGTSLAMIAGQFTNDYTQLTNAMNNIVKQSSVSS